MIALIWGAVRARRAQVLTVGGLTALAAAVAAAGPWFAAASAERAADAGVAAAPAGQRTVSIRQITDTDGDPIGTLERFGAQVRELLPLPAADPVGGLVLAQLVNRGNGTTPMAIAYRDGFCDHVRLEGSCPARAGEAAISRDAADRLGVPVGGRVTLRSSPTVEPVRVTVVGLYERADPTGAYWSNALFRAEGSGFDPAFTPLETFRARQLWEPTIAYDVGLPDAMLRGDELSAELRAADARFSGAGLNLVNTTGPLFAAIARDRAEIRTGVLVAMLQVLLLGWFAIGLAGRYTGRDRRGDAALLKLRGTTRGAMLRLAWGQHLVPLLLGGLLGLPLGVLLARLVAGPIGAPVPQVLLGVAAVGAVLAGGLAVLAVLEALVLRRPVADLLRQVVTGRGTWRGGLADLLLVAVAIAAVYQARSSAASGGLASAAPTLVALAVALLLARLLGRVADRGGGAALRAGRLRLGLTAVQVSRQPGSDRVFALIVVAVAVFVTALGGWRAESGARAARSAAELGADRVLTVQATNRTALVQAVRAADPGGERAMAVLVDTGANPPLLAVDSARLAAVARWRPEFGPLPAAAEPVASPLITGQRLTVRVRHDGITPSSLGLVLLSEATGAPVTVRFGPLRRGEQTVTAPLTGCSAAPGCRVLRWELTSPPRPDGSTNGASDGTSVTVHALSQQEPSAEILGPAELGDIARWRTSTGETAIDVAAGQAGLRLAVDVNRLQSRQIGTEVFAVDVVLPLPVRLAGPSPAGWQFAEPSLTSFSGTAVPVRVAGVAPALPVLGRNGVITDLEAVRRLGGDTGPAATFQVWLTADAGPSMVDALTAAGLRITGDETAGARADRLAEQAPAAVTRFSLLCGLVALLLAAAAIAVVGAVDRRVHRDQLGDLRVQGLSRPVAAVAAWAGTAALIAAGVAGGLAAALLAGPVARVTVPGFTDGWRLLPPPPALSWTSVVLAALAAAAVLGLTGWLAVRSLARTVGRR